MPNYTQWPIRQMPIITTMTATEVSTASANTSEAALVANDDRYYALFVNDSNKPMYLRLGETAVQHEGILLAASGGSYETNWTNLYQGVVNVICEEADKVLIITEGTIIS